MEEACGTACRTAARNPGKAAGCCSVILLIVLIATSISSLEITEIGLNYSWISSDVEPRGYAAGLYFLGPLHHFIKFPAIVKTIQFSNEHDSAGPPLRTRTSDGLEVSLEISFQYQLNATSISDLYDKFGTDYEKVYVNMAMDLMTTMGTGYSATAFFSDRPNISADMEDSLKSHFGTDAYAQVPFFQLRSVTLPRKFEDAIQETEVMKQDILTAQQENLTMEVTMQTKLLQAQQHAQAVVLAGNATAQSTLLQAQAWVEQYKLSQNLQATSFKSLYGKLGNNESLLLEYMRTRAMRDHPNHLSVVGISNA